jgi:hypothetical protein
VSIACVRVEPVSAMPVTIYLKSNPAWPLLAVRRDGQFYVGDRHVPRTMIDRWHSQRTGADHVG